MATVSVLMATYKEEKQQLSQAIESILNQTYQDFEFIIILDNPKNEELVKLIEDYKEKDPRIIFFINEQNMGLPKTLNKAITLATGEYICRMDADDISEPYRISEQLKYLKENHYDLVGGLSTMIDEDGGVIYKIKSVPTDFSKIKKLLRYNQVISHPTWFGKKGVFEELNGYRLIPLCEDYDFTLRAVLKGFRISNLNKNVLNYRMTKGSISRSNLFDQYLFQCYITRQYSKGKIADIREAISFVNNHSSEKKRQRYLAANEIFNNALKNIQEKKYCKLVINCAKLIFSSKYYLNKIYRLYRVSKGAN